MDVVPPELVDALNAASPSLLQIQGVNGVDIGLNDAGGFTIRILVSDPNNPPQGLPNTVGDFPFILIAGQPTLEQATIPDAAKYDPVTGGIQLAPATIVGGNVRAGTLGCVFRDS